MAQDNVGPVERLISLITGLGLSVAALRRGTLVGRSAASAAGVLLIARGVTAYCPVKGALGRGSSLQDGFREQWSRVRSGPAREIGSLRSLYIAEVQELHSAETQLGRFLGGLRGTLQNTEFARLLEGYDTEVHSRREDLAQLLRASGASPLQHVDQGMRALLFETRKVSNVGSVGVREAAVLSSLQRVLHFKIAGYGTVATYAKQLGRPDEASTLAGYGDRDKQLDAELTRIAASLVNSEAERGAAAPRDVGTDDIAAGVAEGGAPIGAEGAETAPAGTAATGDGGTAAREPASGGARDAQSGRTH